MASAPVQYVRKIGTVDEIYVYTPELMERGDMELLPLSKSLRSAPVAPPEPSEPAIDPNRITVLVEAMHSLMPEDYTAQGKPKIEALANLTGIEDITGKERDAAFEEWQNTKV